MNCMQIKYNVSKQYTDNVGWVFFIVCFVFQILSILFYDYFSTGQLLERLTNPVVKMIKVLFSH